VPTRGYREVNVPVQLEYREHGVILWHWGVVTGDEVIPANREIYRHVFADAFRFQLIDLAHVTDWRLTAEDMRTLALDDADLTGPHPQVAAVVATSDYLYGMCRMWNMMAETDSFRTYVVRSVDEALELFREHDIELERPVFPGADAD